MSKICSSCHQKLGTNGNCAACARYRLSQDARNMDRDKARGSRDEADKYLKDPPWYARFMPAVLFRRFQLLLRMLGEAMNGAYPLPQNTVFMIAAAIAYVVSPVDLIPDVLIPLGFVDDAGVVGALFAAIEHDLRAYVAARGLDPAPYGL